MNIKPNDLVLEIGSGDKPHPRSDVLLDKLPEDSSERDEKKELVIDRPLVIADGEALPFPGQSFDYIIASHVLEHAGNPAAFLNELSRVGKRGYLETPTALRERVFNWPFHRWYVYQKNKKLVLIKKTKRSKLFFAGMSMDKRKKLDDFKDKGKKLDCVRLEWQGKINYQIIREEPTEFLKKIDKKLAFYLKEQENYLNQQQSRARLKIDLMPKIESTALFIKKWLYYFKRYGQDRLEESKRHQLNLMNLIVCPVCKGRLEVKRVKLDCSGCRRQFSFYKHGGQKIPILLP